MSVCATGFEVDHDKRSFRDQYRAKYRICPDENQDALLMIIRDNSSMYNERPEPNDIIYVIGKEKEDIHITQDGYLFFAVNDIVLDQMTIVNMILDITNSFIKVKQIASIDTIINNLKERPCPLSLSHNDYSEFLSQFGISRQDLREQFLQKWNDENNEFHFQSVQGHKDMIELYGYFINDYKNAWFDDNVGSFLIIVETTKK